MRERQEELVQNQRAHLEALSRTTLLLIRDGENSLQESTKESLRALVIWIQRRTQRMGGDQLHGTKISLTRMRLLGLQLERILDQVANFPHPEKEQQLCSKLDSLLASQQQRDLYDDMISCLRELSALSIERGQGRQAVLYNEMASKLESRLESGYLNLDDLQQRSQDEALYREFREKLSQLKG